MRTSDFDYSLPPELIAQVPAFERDQSRLLVLDRNTRGIQHRMFHSLADYVRAGDVLVLNDSRVIPARLRATNTKTGGQFEILLLEQNSVNDWWVMLKPGKRARLRTEMRVRDLQGNSSGIVAAVVEVNSEGHRRLLFSGSSDVLRDLDHLGEVPLPPYIVRGPESQAPAQSAQDRLRYQTIFARAEGSVAAPTAGLHFTSAFLDLLKNRGVEICCLTLHVGLGTFAPVKAAGVSAHVMHEERFELSRHTALAIERARSAGNRIIAVGTTTVRVLESVAARCAGRIEAQTGKTRIFIYPPCNFKAVDALLTNFHLPRSTLLMLVSAFAAPGKLEGREMILEAYAEAVREGYRFFSYGDAMLVI